MQKRVVKNIGNQVPIKRVASVKKPIVANNPVRKMVTRPVAPLKKVAVRKTVSPPLVSKPLNIERTLVENFVGLQKVIVNLATKLDNLSNQMAQLLNLFEISAKTIAEKGGMQQGGVDRRLVEKIDSLVEQNKTIARGVALLHEPRTQALQSPQMRRPQNLNQPPMQMQPQQQGNMNQYTKSISSNSQKFNPLPQN